jgi:hypothetical protein
MSWLSWHEVSERFASDAHLALREGKRDEASALFGSAAEAESRALEELDPSKVSTLGITAVSAVALWFKADKPPEAEREAMRWLASDRLPSFAVRQLRQLVQSIWTSQTMRDAGVSFLPGQVIVSVKGEQTVVGGAPLDLIIEKVEAVQALFYRTIEYLKASRIADAVGRLRKFAMHAGLGYFKRNPVATSSRWQCKSRVSAISSRKPDRARNRLPNTSCLCLRQLVKILLGYCLS